MPPMSEDLKAVIQRYVAAWKKMSWLYAFLSIFLRVTLIIASALVAIKVVNVKFYTDEGIRVIDLSWLPLLSVYVAIATGLEAWLKPREKWKGFMADCESAEDLLMCLENTAASDPKQIDEFRLKFQRILSLHREKTVF
jgi:hypothetical protein